MDLAKVLSELREELADLDAAIESLEQFQQDRPRRGQAANGLTENGGEVHSAAAEPGKVDGRNRDTA
jgi:hypothetical protein